MPQGPCRPTVCSAKSPGPRLSCRCRRETVCLGRAQCSAHPRHGHYHCPRLSGSSAGTGRATWILQNTLNTLLAVSQTVSVSRDSMQVIAGSLGSQPIGGSGPSGLRLCLERFKGAIINKTFSVFFFCPCTARRGESGLSGDHRI